MNKIEHRYTRIDDFEHLLRVFNLHGEKTVFKYFNRAGEVESICYHALADRVRTFAAGLRELGLAGKRIAVIGESSPNWYTAYLAAVVSGGVAIPMDKELATAEIENFLLRAGAEAIVFSPLFETKFSEMAKRHPEIAFLPMEACENEVYGKTVEEILALGKDKPSAIDDGRDRDAMSVMLFTSGTTGTSKCVMLTEHNISAAINSACAAVCFYPEDVLVSVLPVHHTYELCCSLAAMDFGCEIAINDSLRHALRNFKRFQPTALVLVPLFLNTMEKRIWDELQKKKLDKLIRVLMKGSNLLCKVGLDARRLLFRPVLTAFGGRLTKIICGGAPLNQAVADTFRSMGVNVWEGYGITECSPLISVDCYYHSKPGSVGPHVDSCIVSIKDGCEDENGHFVGEICVKGKNVMPGYYDSPEATADAFTEDGWFRTGDIGYMDEEGYIYITGREKSVIVLENGKNVFPEEIEEALETVKGIAECVVVGRKEAGSDTVILTAIIYPDHTVYPENADKSAIQKAFKAEIAKVNRRLVGYKQIRKIEVRDTEFEKTTTRKIKRNLVK